MWNLILISIYCLILNCIPAFPANVSAGETDEEIIKLSLSQAVEIALANNSLINEATEQWKAAIEEQKAVRTGFLPKFSTNYLYTGLKEDPYANIGGHRTIISDTNQHHWDFTISQPIFTGFALISQYNLAGLSIQIKEMEKKLAVMDVVKQIKISYFILLMSQKLSMVADETVKNLEAHEQDASKYFDQGIISYNDLLRAKVALANARQEYERSLARVSQAESSLSLLLNMDATKRIVTQDDFNPTDQSFEMPELILSALNQRPEIDLLNLALQSFDETIRLAKSDHYPHVAAIGRYEQNGDDFYASDNDYGNQYNAGVSVQATWTLFEWGKTRSEIAKYRHQKAALAERLNATENAVKAEVKNAFINLYVSEKNIQTALESLGQSKESWRITDLQFHQHIATTTDVLDARTLLTQAETNYYLALYGYGISLAELERAVGKNLISDSTR